MIEFAVGALAAAILYTFFPSLAVVPSGWLRKAWAWIRDFQGGTGRTGG